MDTTSKRVGLIDELCVAFSNTPQRVTRRRCPLYFTPIMSAGIFELRRIICNRRSAEDNWGLIPSVVPPLVFGGRLHIRWEVVARNIDRARRITLRSGVVKDDMNVGPTSSDDGVSPHAPAAGGGIPALSLAPSHCAHPLAVLGPSRIRAMFHLAFPAIVAHVFAVAPPGAWVEIRMLRFSKSKR